MMTEHRAHGIGKCVLDQHALCVAGDQLTGSRALVIGEQNGWLVGAEIFDKELAEGTLARAGFLFIDARRSILALRQIEIDDTPSGCWQLGDFFEQSRRAPAQRDEDNAVLIKPIEPLKSGEFGIEDEVLRRAAMLPDPEVDEAEDLVSLSALADIGI